MADGGRKHKQRRVLLLIDKLGGGTGRVFADLARSIDRSAFSVHLAPLAEGGGLIGEIPGDVALHSVLSPKRSWRTERFLALNRLRKLVREARIDLVVSALEISNIYAAMLKRLNPALNVILCYHTNLSAFRSNTRERFTFFGLPMEWYVRRMYPWADAIVSPSKGAAEDLVHSYGISMEKSRWIHNPVDIRRVERLASEPAKLPWKRSSAPVLSAVGMQRFIDHKGFDLLVRALGELRGKSAPRLVLLGSGPQEEDVRRLADSLGLADRIWFAGYQENPWKFAAQSDLFVLPSRWETFGLVLVEAMASGLPVLAANCPYGPSEIIRHGKDGWIVPPNDPKALADGIEQLLRDQTLLTRLREGGRRRAQGFDHSKKVREYESLFGEVART